MALLNRGQLEQVGRPEELYLEPRTVFAARFVGQASTLEGVLEEDGKVLIGDPRYQGRGVVWRGVAGESLRPGTEVQLVARPEALEISRKIPDDALAGRVSERPYAGEVTYYRLELEIGGEVLVIGAADAAREGDQASASPRAGGPPPRIFRRVGKQAQ